MNENKTDSKIIPVLFSPPSTFKKLNLMLYRVIFWEAKKIN